MFNFIFKMFTDGAAALPRGGMQAIAQQLADKATAKGVDIRTSQPVAKLSRLLEQDGGGYLIETQDGKTRIQANVVIIATDGVVSQKMISQMDGFEYLEGLATQQPQRSVGCLYYSFAGAEPVQEPILILNGMGKRERGSFENPVNNVCFPSVVNMGYAPNGCGLCSVTVLEPAMSAYEGQEDKLDKAVRKQLATWFPEYEQEVLKTWKLRRIYRIPRAQPGQLGGPYPANVNGGRDCSMYRGRTLPAGLLVCGDHMATATLNGALESGVKAGEEAAAEAVN
jgi:phytoene dehydrogenase-like protein